MRFYADFHCIDIPKSGEPTSHILSVEVIEVELNSTNAWTGRVGADSFVEMICKRG